MGYTFQVQKSGVLRGYTFQVHVFVRELSLILQLVFVSFMIYLVDELYDSKFHKILYIYFVDLL